MKLAISNMAWASGMDDEVSAALCDYPLQGIEIAPSKVWEQPLTVDPRTAAAYRRYWEDRQLPIVALQSLVFDRADLLLFGSAKARRDLLAHLKGMVELAVLLGVGTLVFGSPKNRRRNNLTEQRAFEIAVPFFRELGDYSAERCSCFCIEPNAAQYGCDFIVAADQGWELVQAVGSEGFGLHLDIGCMELSGEDSAVQLARYAQVIKHLHYSETELAPVRGFSDFLSANKDVLASYPGYVSVEMKAPLVQEEVLPNICRVFDALIERR